MSDKKKWQFDDPTAVPPKRWLGGCDDYLPNGYNLEDELGLTSHDKNEMYADAVRGLRATIKARREQKKKEDGTK
jgi:hypothetical protein